MIAITNKQLLALKDKIDTLYIRAIIRTDDNLKIAKVKRLFDITEKSFVTEFLTEFDNEPDFCRHEYIAKCHQTEGNILECMYFIMTDYNQHIEGYEVTEHGELIDLETGEILQP